MFEGVCWYIIYLKAAHMVKCMLKIHTIGLISLMSTSLYKSDLICMNDEEPSKV